MLIPDPSRTYRTQIRLWLNRVPPIEFGALSVCDILSAGGKKPNEGYVPERVTHFDGEDPVFFLGVQNFCRLWCASKNHKDRGVGV